MITSLREVCGIIRKIVEVVGRPHGAIMGPSCVLAAGFPQHGFSLHCIAPDPVGLKKLFPKKNFSCASRICTARDCEHYVGGAIGERFCVLGLWSENKLEKLPRLTTDGAVQMPADCKRGLEKKNDK